MEKYNSNEYTINIQWRSVADVWLAVNAELQIAMEDASFDSIISKVKWAVKEFLKSKNQTDEPVSLHFVTERHDELSVGDLNDVERLVQCEISTLFYSEIPPD